MASTVQLELKSLDDLPSAAAEFLKFISDQPVRFIAFYGEMGAGKTTFISALMREMLIEDHGSSPTFALINEYFLQRYGHIFHCDF